MIFLRTRKRISDLECKVAYLQERCKIQQDHIWKLDWLVKELMRLGNYEVTKCKKEMVKL